MTLVYSAKNMLYYKRELLCYSLDKERIDLITISDCQGLTDIEEPRVDDRLFPNRDEPRCKWIAGKKVISSLLVSDYVFTLLSIKVPEL